jgi:hypothetical protein
MATPSQFDNAIKAAYVKDDVQMVRKFGLLDMKEWCKGYLSFGNYGHQKKSSNHAFKQGQRDDECRFIRFFKENMKVMIKYKMDELSAHWLPPDCPGIEVFSNNGLPPDPLMGPPFCELKPWLEQKVRLAFNINNIFFKTIIK